MLQCLIIWPLRVQTLSAYKNVGLIHVLRKKEWNYGESVSSFTTDNWNDGVGILLRNKDIEIKEKIVIEEGRCLCLTLSF